MFSTLQCMGFGPFFIRWVRLLYFNVRSSVFLMVIARQYSFLLGVFGRAVRSPRYCTFSLWKFSLSTSGVIPLFLVYYYPPFCLLSHALSSLHADDTSAIVNTDNGIKAVFETYGRFEKAFASKLNLGKCKGL